MLGVGVKRTEMRPFANDVRKAEKTDPSRTTWCELALNCGFNIECEDFPRWLGRDVGLMQADAGDVHPKAIDRGVSAPM